MAKTKQQQQDELNEYLDAMVEPGVEATKQWSDVWSDGVSYAFGNQLYRQRRRKGWDRIQVNFIWPSIRQELAIYSQRRPIVKVQGYEPGDDYFGTLWDSHMPYLWDNVLDMPMQVLRASLDCKVYGYCVSKISWNEKAVWDQKLRQWVGNPVVKLIRPQSFFVDPDAESLDDAQYIGSSRWVDLEYAKATWPQFADALEEAQAEDDGIDEGGSALQFSQVWDGQRDDEGSQLEMLTEGRIARFVDGKQGGVKLDKGDGSAKRRTVKLEEIYWRDHSEVERVEKVDLPPEAVMDGLAKGENGLYVGPDGQPVMPDTWPTQENRWKEPAYPNGRYVIRVGKVILNPKPESQRWLYRRWPYAVGVNSILPHLWQGMNQVEPSRGLQDWLNLDATHILNHVRHFADPVHLVEEGALQESKENRSVADRIKAGAGAIIRLARGGLSKIRREPPPPMSDALLRSYEIMSDSIRDQLGLQDMAMGKHMTSQTATEAANLATAASMTTSLQSFFMDRWTVETMRRVVELCEMRYEPGRLLRTAGGQGERGSVPMYQAQENTEFDLKLDVTSALPFDKEKQQQNAIMLTDVLTNPAIPMGWLEHLMTLYEVPNVSDLLQEIANQRQMQAQAQMQQQMPQEAGNVE